MIGRIVEIAGDGRHLSVDRGFMKVEESRKEIARIPLDDIGVVLANAHGLTYSNNLLVKLAERGAGMVLCGANHMPAAWLWPVEGHHIQAARMEAQIEAGKPLRKRLWQEVVREKIRCQGAVLESLGGSAEPFRTLASKVRSGHPDNIEAQAARRYWPMAMGENFRRDRATPGANAMLNYGYTVLRAATARAIVATGLHPSIGIHHSNRGNAFRLADDLIEPFRPLVDLAVARLLAAGEREVTPPVKQVLVQVVYVDLETKRGRTPVQTCLERLALSLSESFAANRPVLDFPASPLPLDTAAIGRIAR
jgi:CRISPR-associated protein Cas1